VLGFDKEDIRKKKPSVMLAMLLKNRPYYATYASEKVGRKYGWKRGKCGQFL